MLSVICPVFNEESFIEQLLVFFIHAQPKEKELLIVDGGSSDRTVEIIQRYRENNSNIILLHNPERIVPFALNKAISQARGEVIVRLDAHTEYASDYFLNIIYTFQEVDAQIVGGPMRAVGRTPFQEAVASATSTALGVGNSRFHFEDYIGYTDSVYLGAWKKSIFDRTGLFDEQLKRNQDDEFHYRARSLGIKIYQDRQIRSFYYPRSNPSKLFKQYFEYGLYKPLVLRKVKSEIRLRHLVPAAFVIYALSLVLIYSLLWQVPILLYLVLTVFFAIKARKSFSVTALMIAIFPLIHFAYGIGFLIGLTKLFQGKPQHFPSKLAQTN